MAIEEHGEIGDAMVRGFLEKESTIDITHETNNALAQEKHHPPGTIGVITEEVATKTTKKVNKKETEKLEQQISDLSKLVHQLQNQKSNTSQSSSSNIQNVNNKRFHSTSNT